jgi:hypothetical protein
MPVYRLDPIQPLDPRWSRLSSVCECVWTGADTYLGARKSVAGKTVMAHRPATEHAPIEASPWLNERLSTCVQEMDGMEVPRGMVVKASGEAL